MRAGQPFPGSLPQAVLSVAEMQEVAEVFQGALEHVMGNLVGDHQTHMRQFMSAFILKEKPYLLVTREGVERVMSLVFESPQVTDFVFTLLHTFGSRWGMSGERYSALCANLALSIVPHTTLPDCLVPNALASRLAPSSEDTYRLLVANQWLVVLLLLQLFISVSLQQASHNPKK